MLRIAASAAGDDRDRDGVVDPRNKFRLKAFTHAFMVNGGDQKLSSAQIRQASGPINGIYTGRLTARIDISFPITVPELLGFYGAHDTLRAKRFRGLTDKFRTLDRRGIDRDFI